MTAPRLNSWSRGSSQKFLMLPHREVSNRSWLISVPNRDSVDRFEPRTPQISDEIARY